MTNLAGLPTEVADEMVRRELTEAGIKIAELPSPLGNREVKTRLLGSQSMWLFVRAWYYYIATGPGIPPDIAQRFHETHGKEVRVDGHCGCPSPREWFKGFGVGHYHIDTQEGLNAFAALLRSIYDPKHDPEATPRTGGDWALGRQA